jgi:hypothetical protein
MARQHSIRAPVSGWGTSFDFFGYKGGNVGRKVTYPLLLVFQLL